MPTSQTLENFIARVEQNAHVEAIEEFYTVDATMQENQSAQTAGIDLPLKALVWEDASNQVWVGYNDAAFLAQRHGAAQCSAVEDLRKALTGIAEAAVAK